ncbi:unnamed protein product [Cuscuta campestris]|uniref:Uncharacterized protein n=1 Tax=Cuscuta campestris TaxID=132261 RepID=A0A484KL21_9ASTE|nr:unnamed protein product [Cuscuta campestris]
MSSDSQNISGQSYGSGSQPSSSSHSESSSPPVTPLIRRPSHQSSSQARERVAQEPVPLNQLPGRFNPKVLSWEQWEERLGSLGFLALDVRPVFKESSRVTKKVLAEAGVISEEIGQTLKEKDQVSQLTLLLDSAKLEINDRAERERRLEEELKEERARFALLEEEKKRKIAELEDALGQAEESARAKEEAFPSEAADWAARHHTEVARSLLTAPEETMDFFKVMYQEPEGKRMITEIGSYGLQCGQKDERSLLYARLLKRDPSFDPTKMKLPALYEEEPAPPFPLE